MRNWSFVRFVRDGCLQGILGPALFCISIGVAVTYPATTFAEENIPKLVGTWKGENKTISDKKGFRTWIKTVVITEQKDRRFRGYFTYSAGTKHFFGVIFPDNISLSWVASDSKGYNHGRILGPDRISACYIESWEEATAGCAELTRQSAGR